MNPTTSPTSLPEEKTSLVAELWRAITAAFRSWRDRNRLRQELSDLAERGELHRALTDAGVAEWQLPQVLASDPERHKLLDGMVERLRIETAKPLPGLRDLEWNCATCQAEWNCRDYLAHRSAPDRHEFCPNADSLDAIQVEQAVSRIESIARGDK
jgi:uncharacterized protein YjiS (DUF1127 family)